MSFRTFWPAGLVAAVTVLLLLLQGARRAEERARADARTAEARAVLADGRVRLEASAAGAMEAARTREVVVSIRAKEAADEIAETIGGDAVVAPGVLDRWAATVDGLRAEAGPGGGAADHPGGDDASQPVSTAGEATATVGG